MIHKIILIGLGRQMIKDHYAAVKRRSDLEIVALVDVNLTSYDLHFENSNIPFFTDLNQALEVISPDCAIVCVPHDQY